MRIVRTGPSPETTTTSEDKTAPPWNATETKPRPYGIPDVPSAGILHLGGLRPWFHPMTPLDPSGIVDSAVSPPVRLLKRTKLARADSGATDPGLFRAAPTPCPNRSQQGLPQCWPFCWWVVVVIDHYSRRAMGFAAFPKRPKSLAVRTFLGKAISRANAMPKYLIRDTGSAFWCEDFKNRCRRKGIRPRFGAVGQPRYIAVVERFIRPLKDEGTRRILVPHCRTDLRKERMGIVPT